MSTWRGWNNNRGLLPNILLYLPVGFFATCALPRGLPGAVRALTSRLAGASLAGGIEMAQVHDLGRVSSTGDVHANGIGAGIGAVTAALVCASLRGPLVGALAANPSAALLLTVFCGYRLFPYVPTIVLHNHWPAVQALLTTPNLPPGQFSRYLVTWLFIAAIGDVLQGPRRFFVFSAAVQRRVCRQGTDQRQYASVGRPAERRHRQVVVDRAAASVAWKVQLIGCGFCRYDRGEAAGAVPVRSIAASLRLVSVRQLHARLDRREYSGVLPEVL
jgi:hypothetical protein